MSTIGVNASSSGDQTERNLGQPRPIHAEDAPEHRAAQIQVDEHDTLAGTR